MIIGLYLIRDKRVFTNLLVQGGQLYFLIYCTLTHVRAGEKQTFVFFLSIVWHASTQLRMPAPRGMASLTIPILVVPLLFVCSKHSSHKYTNRLSLSQSKLHSFQSIERIYCGAKHCILYMVSHSGRFNQSFTWLRKGDSNNISLAVLDV